MCIYFYIIFKLLFKTITVQIEAYFTDLIQIRKNEKVSNKQFCPNIYLPLYLVSYAMLQLLRTLGGSDWTHFRPRMELNRPCLVASYKLNGMHVPGIWL